MVIRVGFCHDDRELAFCGCFQEESLNGERGAVREDDFVRVDVGLAVSGNLLVDLA